jgi:hypothetical protein
MQISVIAGYSLSSQLLCALTMQCMDPPQVPSPLKQPPT